MIIVGVSNYTDLITDEAFLQALGNTVLFALALATVIPIFLFFWLLIFALLLNRLRRSMNFFQGLMFVLLDYPDDWDVNCLVMDVRSAGLGPINEFLEILGMPKRNWLTDSNTAIWAVVIVTVWKNIGWAMLFFSDALSKIPKGLFEVADIEGANWWHRIR